MINLITRLFTVVLLSFITANAYAAYATLGDAYAACVAAIAPVNAYGYNVEICDYVAPKTILSKYHIKNGWNGTTWSNDVTYMATVGCTLPAFWSTITNSCFTSPVCISPNKLNLQGTACYLPKECAYPETDNGSGICANNTCPVGQNRNPSTNICQIQPSCGSTETYNIYTNLCVLYPLNCPGHTHANTANDACLADAPLACPTGQHDDGTYICVADDAKGCKSNQQAGYINGIPQCITKINVAAARASAAAAKAALATANSNATTAAEAMRLARVALNANPTSVALQNDMYNKEEEFEKSMSLSTFAAQNAAVAGVESQESLAQDNQSQNEQTNNLLDSLDKTTKSIDTVLKETGKGPEVSDLPVDVAVPTQTIGLASDPDYQASGECPVPIVVSTSFKQLSFSFDYICQFASSISGVVLALAWLAAGRIVFGTSTV